MGNLAKLLGTPQGSVLGVRPGAVVVDPKARRPLWPFSPAHATSRAMSDTGSPTS